MTPFFFILGKIKKKNRGTIDQYVSIVSWPSFFVRKRGVVDSHLSILHMKYTQKSENQELKSEKKSIFFRLACFLLIRNPRIILALENLIYL